MSELHMIEEGHEVRVYDANDQRFLGRITDNICVPALRSYARASDTHAAQVEFFTKYMYILREMEDYIKDSE